MLSTISVFGLMKSIDFCIRLTCYEIKLFVWYQALSAFMHILDSVSATAFANRHE